MTLREFYACAFILMFGILLSGAFVAVMIDLVSAPDMQLVTIHYVGGRN